MNSNKSILKNKLTDEEFSKLKVEYQRKKDEYDKLNELLESDPDKELMLSIVADSANEAINKRGCEVKSKYDYSNLENSVNLYLENMKYRYPTWLEMTISYLCYDDTLHVIFNYKNPLLFLCKKLDRDPDNPDILTKVMTGGLSNKSEFILYRNICQFIDDYVDEVKFFIHGTFTRKPMGFIHGIHPSDCGLNYDVVIKHYDELLKNNTEFIEVTSWIQITSDFPRREFKLHKRTQRSFLPYNELSIMNTRGPLEYYNYVAPFK